MSASDSMANSWRGHGVAIPGSNDISNADSQHAGVAGSSMGRREFVKMLSLVLPAAVLAGAGVPAVASEVSNALQRTWHFTDDLGRDVVLPMHLPARSVFFTDEAAQLLVLSISPEHAVSLLSSISSDAIELLPEAVRDIGMQSAPSFSSDSIKWCKEAEVGLIITTFSPELGQQEVAKLRTDLLQRVLDVPIVCLEGGIDHLSLTLMKAGRLLGCTERAQQVSEYIDSQLAFARQAVANSQKRVAYLLNRNGVQNTLASFKAELGGIDVLQAIGVHNAANEPKLDDEELRQAKASVASALRDFQGSIESADSSNALDILRDVEEAVVQAYRNIWQPEDGTSKIETAHANSNAVGAITADSSIDLADEGICVLASANQEFLVHLDTPDEDSNITADPCVFGPWLSAPGNLLSALGAQWVARLLNPDAFTSSIDEAQQEFFDVIFQR